METEQISWKDMDAACGRIRRLKERFCLPYCDPDPRAARAAAGGGENVALAAEIAERSGIPA